MGWNGCIFFKKGGYTQMGWNGCIFFKKGQI